MMTEYVPAKHNKRPWCLLLAEAELAKHEIELAPTHNKYIRKKGISYWR